MRALMRNVLMFVLVAVSTATAAAAQTSANPLAGEVDRLLDALRGIVAGA